MIHKHMSIPEFLNELDYDEVYIHSREPHENRVSDETEIAITTVTTQKHH